MGLYMFITIDGNKDEYILYNAYNQKKTINYILGLGASDEEHRTAKVSEEHCKRVLDVCSYKIALLKHMPEEERDKQDFPTSHNLAKWRVTQDIFRDALEAIREGKEVEYTEEN